LQTPAAPPLFDSAYLAKLEQLYLLSKRRFRGDQHADRKSRQIGSSLEFADYRTYSLGDDLRSVDWNIYGRLDRLFVKLFEHEQDLHIHFLVDASSSMLWRPAPPGKGNPGRITKFDQARRIAASLAYIGLANLDRVDIHWFSSGLTGSMGLARGKGQFHEIMEFLQKPPQESRPTGLLASFRMFTQSIRRRGVVFILSDLFDPAGYEEALSLLRYHQFEVQIIQVLDPAELDPEAAGDFRLVEPEANATLELTVNEGLLASYRKEINSFLEGLTRFGMERGFGVMQASTAIPFEDLVLRVLRDGILLK